MKATALFTSETCVMRANVASSRRRRLARPIKLTTGLYFSINLFYNPPTMSTTRAYIFFGASQSGIPQGVDEQIYMPSEKYSTTKAHFLVGYRKIKITGKSPITIKYFICVFGCARAVHHHHHHKNYIQYTQGVHFMCLSQVWRKVEIFTLKWYSSRLYRGR